MQETDRRWTHTESHVQPGMCISTRNTSMTAWKMPSGMPRSMPDEFERPTAIHNAFARWIARKQGWFPCSDRTDFARIRGTSSKTLTQIATRTHRHPANTSQQQTQMIDPLLHTAACVLTFERDERLFLIRQQCLAPGHRHCRGDRCSANRNRALCIARNDSLSCLHPRSSAQPVGRSRGRHTPSDRWIPAGLPRRTASHAIFLCATQSSPLRSDFVSRARTIS